MQELRLLHQRIALWCNQGRIVEDTEDRAGHPGCLRYVQEGVRLLLKARKVYHRRSFQRPKMNQRRGVKFRTK
jgi:hypothetical protein